MSDKIITCKKCGKDMPSSTMVCPNCSQRMRLGWPLRIAILVVLLGIIVYFVAFRDNGSSSDPKNNLPTISLSEFNSLKTGMSYQVTAQTIGSAGEKISESGAEATGDYEVTYKFEGEGEKGANATITFKKNRLMTKAQTGLK